MGCSPDHPLWGREGNKTGMIKKLTCCVVAKETSADPVGTLELGWSSRVVLLEAEGQAFIPFPGDQTLDMGCFQGGCMNWARRFSSA